MAIPNPEPGPFSETVSVRSPTAAFALSGVRLMRISNSHARIRIHNLYEDANGESHFRDIEVDWVEETPGGKLSGRLPATGIMFRETTTDYENSWHQAPRRQYVISLAGGISIYRQRWRDAPYRARRDRPGGGHGRQGPHHQIIGRQTRPHDLRANRMTLGER
jgi:hypothetical protein